MIIGSVELITWTVHDVELMQLIVYVVGLRGDISC